MKVKIILSICMAVYIDSIVAEVGICEKHVQCMIHLINLCNVIESILTEVE